MALNRSDKSRILRRYFPGMTRNSEMSTEPSRQRKRSPRAYRLQRLHREPKPLSPERPDGHHRRQAGPHRREVPRDPHLRSQGRKPEPFPPGAGVHLPVRCSQDLPAVTGQGHPRPGQVSRLLRRQPRLRGQPRVRRQHGRLIRRLAADESARRTPSPQEYRFCDISKEDCPARIDVDTCRRGDRRLLKKAAELARTTRSGASKTRDNMGLSRVYGIPQCPQIWKRNAGTYSPARPTCRMARGRWTCRRKGRPQEVTTPSRASTQASQKLAQRRRWKVHRRLYFFRPLTYAKGQSPHIHLLYKLYEARQQ